MQAEFKEAMARLPGGVVIVTTYDMSGAPWGFTASSFSSVSLDTPLVAVSIAKTAECWPHFQTTKAFAVSLLGPHHEETARCFATRGATKFHSSGFEASAGGPVMIGARAAITCATETRVHCGDHTLLIGRVADIELGEDGEGLVYFKRRFWPAGLPEQGAA